METFMKDFLQDLVTHTHSLGFIPLVKIISSDKETMVESIADDRSVVLSAKTHSPVADLDGTFGMPNLNKLDIHLRCPEYKDNAKINVVKQNRNNEVVPTGLHFENATGDFENDYRFMSMEIINDRLKTAKLKNINWDIEFEPNLGSVNRLKFQAQAHSEEETFQVKTENGNLVFQFGDASTHAGSFVFQQGITGKLKQVWAWPVSKVQSILNLPGDISIKISDGGAMQITVDSGIAEYNYILPAYSK